MPASPRKLDDHDLLVAAFTAAKSNHELLAIRYFKEALRRDPEDPFISLEIVKCYHAIHHPSSCRQYLRKAGKFAGDDPSVYFSMAQTYQEIRDTSNALEVLKKLETIEGHRTLALVKQAEIHEKINNLDQAEHTVNKAGNDDTCLPLQTIRTKLALRRGDLDLAQKMIQKLLTETSIKKKNPTAYSEWLYSQASLHNKQKDYTAAYNTYVEAKNILASTDDYQVYTRAYQGIHQRLTTTVQDLKKVDMTRWSFPPNNRKTHVFLLGHPRSGTTLLEQSLDAHENIYSADETAIFHSTVWIPLVKEHSKEEATEGTPFTRFLCDYPTTRQKKIASNYFGAWSRTQVTSAQNDVWIDKNPAQSTRLPLISRIFPTAKIIYALRDPRDVVMSSFMQSLSANDWSVNWLSLEDTVRQYCFCAQMWLDLRDSIPNEWIEVRYEDTVDDIARQSKRATEFLGQDWQPEQANVHQHVSRKVVYSPTYSDVAKPVYRGAIERWRNYAKYLEPHMNLLKPYLDAFGYASH